MNLHSGKAPSIAVTGADGFIGHHLVDRLLQHGCNVRRIIRSKGEALQAKELETVCVAGLDDRAALRRGFADIEVLFHLAANVHAQPGNSSERSMHAVNVEGTRNVMQMAAENDVRHIVFISTIGVFGDASYVDDRTPAAPATPYASTKLEAEHIVRTVAAQTNRLWTILRPPGVYGPRMKGAPLQLYRLVAAGLPIPIPTDSIQRSLLYVDNLVAALIGVARQRVGGCFVVADQEALSVKALVTAIAHSVNRRPRTLTVPTWSLRSLGSIAGRLQHVARLPLNRRTADLFTRSLVVKSELWERLDSQPFSAVEGLRRTGAWFVAQGRS